MLRLAFYKDPGSFINWAIRLVTRSKYSHVELVFSDGISISSSNRDGGVRSKQIDYSDGKWDLIDLPKYSPYERAIRVWAEKQIGRGYDWPGVFGFIFKDIHADDTKMFCSEFCARALGLDKDEAAHTSPGKLYEIAPGLAPRITSLA